jgi:hypothetical protein
MREGKTFFLSHDLSPTTEYTEFQAFCPVVRIGPPTPLPIVSVATLLWVQGRRHTRFRKRVEANSDEGTDILILYVCTV